MEKLYIACEFGPRTSRIMLGSLEHNTLKLGELRKFETPVLNDKKIRQWDIPALFSQTLAGLIEIGKQDVNVAGISCNSWSGDYLLFDRDEALLSPVYHFADVRSEKGREAVLEKISPETIYAETGCSLRNGSTLFQIATEPSRRLKQTRSLLPFADAFNHLLGGVACAEASSASTTQLYSPTTKAWSRRLAADLRLPQEILPAIVSAGTRLGMLKPELAQQAKLEGTQLIATCSNELAAALSGLPQNHGNDWAYLRIGSETLLGTQVGAPIINPLSQALGYSNETCFGGSTNLYRRAIGLSILDECRRYWLERDRELSDDVLMHLATTSLAFETFIDVTDPRFAEPGDMPLKVQAYCRETGQEIPRKPGQILRCVLEGLALHYRKLFHETEMLTGSKFERVYLFGAGENNLLNHFIVNALQVPAIIASPDAASIGNVMVQALTLGHISSLDAAHDILRNSYKLQAIIPHNSPWHVAADRLRDITNNVPVTA